MLQFLGSIRERLRLHSQERPPGGALIPKSGGPGGRVRAGQQA